MAAGGCLFFSMEDFKMADEALLQAVSSVGFPIVVAFYLLVRVQNSLDRFTEKMDALLMEIRHERMMAA